MITVILPGYSQHNKDWLEETAESVRASSEVRPVYWNHWLDPQAKFDPWEKANLLDGVSGKRAVDIIAKSIGVLVASFLIKKSPDKIRKVVFCGVPVNDLSEKDKEIIRDALKIIPHSSIICFQNDEDPHGGVETLKNFLSEFGDDIQIIEKQRADHEYPYQSEFNQFLLG